MSGYQQCRWANLYYRKYPYDPLLGYGFSIAEAFELTNSRFVRRQIVGADMVWQQELEAQLDGGVVSLSVLADSGELLAGTQEGSVYRLLLADLSASKVRTREDALPHAKHRHLLG